MMEMEREDQLSKTKEVLIMLAPEGTLETASRQKQLRNSLKILHNHLLQLYLMANAMS